MENATDKELLIAFQHLDDKMAFGTLFKRYLAKVYSICLYYYKSPEASQDAVMDVFEKVLVSAKTTPIENFEYWISIITQNHCKKRLSEKRLPVVLLDELGLLAEESQATDTKFKAEKTDIQYLKTCIEELSEGQKKCIELHYLEGLSYVEIAASLEIEVNKVKSHIQNGKRNLKNRLCKMMFL